MGVGQCWVTQGASPAQCGQGRAPRQVHSGCHHSGTARMTAAHHATNTKAMHYSNIYTFTSVLFFEWLNKELTTSLL